MCLGSAHGQKLQNNSIVGIITSIVVYNAIRQRLVDIVSLNHCDCDPFQSLLQINVPHLHSEFLSFSPEGPRGRGQM